MPILFTNLSRKAFIFRVFPPSVIFARKYADFGVFHKPLIIKQLHPPSFQKAFFCLVKLPFQADKSTVLNASFG